MEHSYTGFHAIADIIMNGSNSEIVSIFRESIKFSNLKVVSEATHKDSCGISTYFILSESHAVIREYFEPINKVSVDIYTCGEEGDPLSAITEFVKHLDVNKVKITSTDRGLFSDSTSNAKSTTGTVSHQILDVKLNDYPRDMASIFSNTISRLSGSECNSLIHDFGGAITGIIYFEGGHSTIHEYPENDYITVDVFCSKGKGALLAINDLVEKLNVKEYFKGTLNRSQN
jgi:S-adenosylmethionine/arginine decarboxylase-like enzyme